MLKKLIGLVAGTFLINSSVTAAIVTEVWAAEVLSESIANINSTYATNQNPIFVVGDTITWTVTYDSTFGDHYTQYSDGSDGIADRGTNDDTLLQLSCLDINYSSGCESSLANDDFIALYDSTSDISSIYDSMVNSLGSGEVIHNFHTHNQDTRRFRTAPHSDFTDFDYYADEFHISADNRHYPVGGAGSAQIYYEDTAGEIWVKRVGFGNISISSTVVPLPPAAWLFVSGLAGLIGAKYKKC